MNRKFPKLKHRNTRKNPSNAIVISLRKMLYNNMNSLATTKIVFAQKLMYELNLIAINLPEIDYIAK